MLSAWRVVCRVPCTARRVSCVVWLPGQVCDKFAAAGFNVAMPDFCDGKHWLVKDFPPEDMQVCLLP